MNTEAVSTTTTPKPDALVPLHVREVLDQTARLARNVSNLLHLRCLEAPHDKDADALHDLAHDLHARIEAVRAWVGGGSPRFLVGHHAESFHQLVVEIGEPGSKSAEAGT